MCLLFRRDPIPIRRGGVAGHPRRGPQRGGWLRRIELHRLPVPVADEHVVELGAAGVDVALAVAGAGEAVAAHDSGVATAAHPRIVGLRVDPPDRRA